MVVSCEGVRQRSRRTSTSGSPILIFRLSAPIRTSAVKSRMLCEDCVRQRRSRSAVQGRSAHARGLLTRPVPEHGRRPPRPPADGTRRSCRRGTHSRASAHERLCEIQGCPHVPNYARRLGPFAHRRHSSTPSLSSAARSSALLPFEPITARSKPAENARAPSAVRSSAPASAGSSFSAAVHAQRVRHLAALLLWCAPGAAVRARTVERIVDLLEGFESERVHPAVVHRDRRHAGVRVKLVADRHRALVIPTRRVRKCRPRRHTPRQQLQQPLPLSTALTLSLPLSSPPASPSLLLPSLFRLLALPHALPHGHALPPAAAVRAYAPREIVFYSIGS